MEIVAALVGLGGVFVGAAVTWYVAVWAARGTYNIEETRASRLVIAEALSAGDELFVAHAATLEHIRVFIMEQRRRSQAGEPYETNYIRPPDLLTRVTESTARWRAALSSMYLRLGQELSTAMREFDQARAEFVSHLNEGRLEQAGAVQQGGMQEALRRMKLAADVEGCRINLVIVEQFEPRRSRKRARRLLAKRLEAAVARLSEPSGPSDAPLQTSTQIDGAPDEPGPD